MIEQVRGLIGRRILVVEDDYLIAGELVESLEELGASVAGPAPSATEALALMEREARLDAAVLDVNLGSQDVFPVADALQQRGIPFVFATGYDQWVIPTRYAGVRRFEKPIDTRTLARTLFG